jgi:hypothetical protein
LAQVEIMTAEEWTNLNDEEEQRHRQRMVVLSDLRESIKFPNPDELRPATARDIVVGAIIYYPLELYWIGAKQHTRPAYWSRVDQVRHPDDDFKAYVADDGCRYGLSGAFVRKTTL